MLLKTNGMEDKIIGKTFTFSKEVLLIPKRHTLLLALCRNPLLKVVLFRWYQGVCWFAKNRKITFKTTIGIDMIVSKDFDEFNSGRD